MTMEDGNVKKPLRQTTNKAKDIFNTYLKHEGGKSIPISSQEEEIQDKEIQKGDKSSKPRRKTSS